MKLTRIPHLDGDMGVEQTIRQMRRLIQQGKQDPKIHELAAQILRCAKVPAYDWTGEARAIFDWWHRNIRFTRDVDGHETLHAPADILRLGIGDCDDFTVGICSLLKTIGADCRIVTIAVTPDGEFSHVYPEVILPSGRSIALDAARQSAAFGKTPENCTRKCLWSVDSEERVEMGRLGYRQSVAPGQGPQGAWRANVYPPFRPAAREMTGTYLSAFPVAPPHQQFKRPPIGFGNYGVPAARRALADFSRGDLRRTLGQDGFDWSSLSTDITAASTGAANIISAERASPYNLFPTTSTAAKAGTALPLTSPYGTPLVSSPLGLSMSPTTLLLLGIGAVALIAVERH
jgi:Transglutaminase-like superfamily